MIGDHRRMTCDPRQPDRCGARRRHGTGRGPPPIRAQDTGNMGAVTVDRRDVVARMRNPDQRKQQLPVDRTRQPDSLDDLPPVPKARIELRRGFIGPLKLQVPDALRCILRHLHEQQFAQIAEVIGFLDPRHFDSADRGDSPSTHRRRPEPPCRSGIETAQVIFLQLIENSEPAASAFTVLTEWITAKLAFRFRLTV